MAKTGSGDRPGLAPLQVRFLLMNGTQILPMKNIRSFVKPSSVVAFTIVFVALVMNLPGSSIIPNAIRTQKIRIKVMDRKTGTPVENAIVNFDVFNSIATDITHYSGTTGHSGECTITYETDKGYTFTARATKEGLYQCFSADPADMYVSSMSFTKDPGKEITLWLTTDAGQIIAYYSSIIPHYSADSLIRLLRANPGPPAKRIVLPELRWSDIPRLLAAGNEMTVIKGFPVNLLSSSDPRECRLGIYCLWLVEAIRITESNRNRDPFLKFPSLVPLISVKESKGDPGKALTDDTSALLSVYIAYADWWNRVKNMDPADACRIDPLENSKFSW